MNKCESCVQAIKKMVITAPPVSVWQSIVNTCTSNLGKTYTDSVTTFGSVGTSQNKWANGALAPNGKIYCRPIGTSSILVIDTTNDTTSTIKGISGSWQWSNFVLSSDGYIYGAPLNASTFIKIDPSNNTFTTFNSTVGTGWSVLNQSENHLIYGHKTSTASDSILIFDPIKGTQTTVSSVNTKGLGSSCYHPNGCIYGSPAGGGFCYKFNTSDNTSLTFGTFSTSTDNKYLGTLVSYNEYVYCVPGIANTALKIDVSNNTTSTFGRFSSSDTKWHGGAFAPNGCIYCIPFNASSILKINTNNNTVSTFGNVGTDILKWHGGVLAPNGCIYGIPRNASKVLKINPGSNVNTNFSEEALLSPYLNH